MIDLYTFRTNLQPEIKSYSGIPQLIRADQDVNSEDLIYPRITYKMSSPYDINGNAQSMFIKKEVVPSDDPDFDKDIEYSYYSNPRVTISFNAFGKNVSQYISKLIEWFRIPKLGQRFLDQHDVVIINVTNMQDRTTYLQTDYEDRKGFDVVLQFNDEVKIIEKTFEEVELEVEFSDDEDILDVNL